MENLNVPLPLIANPVLIPLACRVFPVSVVLEEVRGVDHAMVIDPHGK
jgi:hypothetical protein